MTTRRGHAEPVGLQSFDALPPLDLTASWCTCPDGACVLEDRKAS